MGDYRKAIRLGLEAVEVLGALNTTEAREALATAHGNLGAEYGRMGDQQRSKKHLHRAIHLNTELGRENITAENLCNLGAAHIELGEIDSAIIVHERSLAIAHAVPDSALIAQNLHNLGELYLREQRDDAARQSFDESISISRRLGMPYGEMLTLRSLAHMVVKRNSPAAAIPLLTRAMELAQEMKLKRQILLIHRELGAALDRTGNGRRAYAHATAALAMHDTLYGPELGEEIHHLETEFELRRQSYENEQLRLEKQLADVTMHEQQRTLFVRGVGLVLLLVILALVLLNRRRKVRALAVQAEQQRRLEEASHRLEESNSLKEMLLDVMAHDLRNPVSTIGTAIEVLELQPDNPRMLHVVRDSCRQIGHLVDNATTLTRIASDEHIPLSDLSLDNLLADLAAAYASPLKSAAMTLAIDIPAGTRIHAHPIITEVFRNLIENAIRHAASGGLLRIDVTRQEDGMCIRVEDRGDSIAEADRERVFTRGQHGTTHDRSGSGLGLAIVRRIITAHRGRVWIEPGIPTGNRFCILLPHA